MELLITTWRKQWGYDLPVFWMQLHGWGPGGGASDSTCFWGGGKIASFNPMSNYTFTNNTPNNPEPCPRMHLPVCAVPVHIENT